jgi:arginyl-tRNA synthetase
MDILATIGAKTKEALASLYDITEGEVSFENTNAKFAGDYTFVVFPYLRHSRKKPEDTAAEIGDYLKEHVAEIEDYNVVKGFLNLELSDDYWLEVAKNSNRCVFCLQTYTLAVYGRCKYYAVVLVLGIFALKRS